MNRKAVTTALVGVVGIAVAFGLHRTGHFGVAVFVSLVTAAFVSYGYKKAGV